MEELYYSQTYLCRICQCTMTIKSKTGMSFRDHDDCPECGHLMDYIKGKRIESSKDGIIELVDEEIHGN